MIYGVQGQNSRLQLQVPKVAIAVRLHIRCRLLATSDGYFSDDVPC